MARDVIFLIDTRCRNLTMKDVTLVYYVTLQALFYSKVPLPR